MLKMAPNSLFAILLRSPWWMSIGIALALALASKALLPDAFWVVGAMSGIPFFGIGFVALRRQLRAPSAKRVEAILTAAGKASWRDFAEALESAYTRAGWTVERIEGAADLAISRGGRTTLVAAKRWKAARHGEDGVRALHAAMTSREASDCVYIALGELSGNAQRLAKAQKIQILQGAELAQLLRHWPT